MPPHRLVASDIDGTLVTDAGSLTARTIGAIDRLRERGVPVVLVTGRPVRWLSQLYDQMAEPVPAVCANGAVVYDPHADEVLTANPLGVEELLEVTKKLRDEIPGIALAVEVEDGRKFWYEQAWPPLWNADHKGVRMLTSPAEITSMPAVKLLARLPDSTPDAFFDLVSRTLGPVVETTHSSSSALVEISAAGVTKATGLAWLCERDGYPAADVVAFGDMPNDLAMLSWAGRSVAMANAHRSVLSVADEVTLSNDEDGVAVWLERAFSL
jgi:hypothetical protein